MEIATASMFATEVPVDPLVLTEVNPYNISNQMGEGSNASYFSPEDEDSQFQGFASLVASRITYLSGLNELDPNWINGTSETPNSDSIKSAVGFLNLLQKEVEKNKLSIPNLIMSPIPSGGVSLEVSKSDSNLLLVTFKNDGTVEMELEQKDTFYEMSNLKSALNLFHGYSEW